MLQHLSLVSIVTMWVGTAILLRRHLPDRGKTISRHAAKNSRYYIAFGAFEVLVVSAFSFFMFGWFIPVYQLGWPYAAAALVGLAGTLIAAIIPDRDGWRARVHGMGAYGMAVSLLVMNALLLASSEVSIVARVAAALGCAYMATGVVVAFWLNRRLYRRHALVLQVMYFLWYQVPIVLAVYW